MSFTVPLGTFYHILTKLLASLRLILKVTDAKCSEFGMSILNRLICRPIHKIFHSFNIPSNVFYCASWNILSYSYETASQLKINPQSDRCKMLRIWYEYFESFNLRTNSQDIPFLQYSFKCFLLRFFQLFIIFLRNY